MQSLSWRHRQLDMSKAWSFMAPYSRVNAQLVPFLLFSRISTLTTVSHLKCWLPIKLVGNGFLVIFLKVMSSLSFCLFISLSPLHNLDFDIAILVLVRIRSPPVYIYLSDTHAMQELWYNINLSSNWPKPLLLPLMPLGEWACHPRKDLGTAKVRHLLWNLFQWNGVSRKSLLMEAEQTQCFAHIYLLRHPSPYLLSKCRSITFDPQATGRGNPFQGNIFNTTCK